MASELMDRKIPSKLSTVKKYGFKRLNANKMIRTAARIPLDRGKDTNPHTLGLFFTFSPPKTPAFPVLKIFHSPSGDIPKLSFKSLIIDYRLVPSNVIGQDRWNRLPLFTIWKHKLNLLLDPHTKTQMDPF
jgi:hypothetical protein